MSGMTWSAWTASLGRAACGLTFLLATTVVADAVDLGHKRPRGMDLAKLAQLTTHEGRLLGPGALRGRPFVVAFGFTHCPDVCPTTLLDLSNHLAALGPKGDKLGVVFVSIDPERDTVENLRSYLTSFDPRIIGLTGVAAAPANLAIQPSALAKEPYRVTVALPGFATAGQCDIGRTGRVTFEK